jgi:hypothetical protein
VVKARIFIEGGSPGETSDAIFKQSWQKFFHAAGLTGRMPAVVRGTNRNETFDKFKDALSHQTRIKQRHERLLLLVDSEGPVIAEHTAWQHLKDRPEDDWDEPPFAGDDSAFLMVQFMETWFLSDRDALQTVFGQNFNSTPVRAWSNLEAVPKDTVLDTLKRATNGRYEKGTVSFRMLAKIDPDLVAAACPHAKELLDFLRSL